MQGTTHKNEQNPALDQQARPAAPGTNAFPVRTNLRAGLSWDELDDQTLELWNQLSSTVGSAVDNVTPNT